MAVPSVPADVSAGGSLSPTHMNELLDVAAWLQDGAPTFKGQAQSNSGTSLIDIATGTSTTMGFGNAGSFEFTPIINVGSWTVNAADSDPESLLVPEAGHYLVTVGASWEANATGYRQIRIWLNGAAVEGGDDNRESAGAVTTFQTCTTVLDLAANDQLDVRVIQNSGSTLECTAFLSAKWIVST